MWLGLIPVLALYIWLLGILPFAAMGLLAGMLLGVVIGFCKARLSTVGVVCIASLAGILLNLFIHYRIWVGRSPNFHRHYTFLQYLLPISSLNDLSHFYFFTNPFFVPSVISLAAWFYVGWRLKQVKALQG